MGGVSQIPERLPALVLCRAVVYSDAHENHPLLRRFDYLGIHPVKRRAVPRRYPADGMHLDPGSRGMLGEALEKEIRSILTGGEG